MRRISILFAVLCAMAGISGLSAPGALAAHPPAKPPAPAGWALVKGQHAGLAPRAHKTGHVPGPLIRSISLPANDRYVSAELGYQGQGEGMLRARATEPKTWERFDLMWDDGSDAYALRSRANHRYVSAELGYQGQDEGMLRARATQVGEWERFYLYRNTRSGLYSLLSKANTRWVSAELGYGGRSYAMLRARATQIGPWEQFKLS